MNHSKSHPERKEFLWDTIIIGGGPAGLSAAIYAARKLMRTLVISQNIGGQMNSYADIENYLGFSHLDATDLLLQFEEHVEKFGIEVREGTRITNVHLSGTIKQITTDEGETLFAKTVIVATGKRPKLLNITGERDLVGKGVAFCSTCDAPLYGGQDVAVVGGGNSVVEAVIDLLKIAQKIYLVSTTEITADPILVNRISETDKVLVLTKHVPVAILGSDRVSGLRTRSIDSEKEFELSVTGVFVEIGLLPNSEVFLDHVSTNRWGEILVDERCRTGVPGVFACGDVTSVPYKQVIVAAGEGAKAALAAHAYLISGK